MLGRFYDGIEYRGAGQRRRRDARGVRRRAGLERPHRRLAPDPVPLRRADDARARRQAGRREIAYAYVGDARFNMGNSLLVTGAMLGMDVRIVAPRSLWPSDAVVAVARRYAAETGARVTLTEDVAEGVRGVDFVHTDVWVSMGEPKEVWAERIELLTPYQVNADLLALTGNPRREVHALPPRLPRPRDAGRSATCTSSSASRSSR